MPMLFIRQHQFEIILFVFSLILFSWGLSSQEIIGFDSRFYLFAREMQQYGLSWFPTTYHKPYPDYSSASTILIYLTAHCLGGLNKWTAVLPSAAASSMTVVLTYLIGAIHSKRFGLAAVFCLLLTFTFLTNARAIALDMYPTVITATCFYLIYSADQMHYPRRGYWIYPLLLLGFIFRGPIGLVIPTAVICIYYLLDRRIKQFFIAGLLALCMLLIGIALLLLLAYQTGGEAFVQDVLRMQILGRVTNYDVPIYFYLVDGLLNYAISFPIACTSLVGIMLCRNGLPHAKLLLKLAGWFIIILIGMSIPGDKKIRYILPIAPAIALLAAYPLVFALAEPYFVRLRSIVTRFLLCLPAILLFGMAILFFYTSKHHLPFPIAYGPVAIILVILQSLMIWRRQSVLSLLLGAMFSFVITLINVIEPIELYINRARDFVVAMEAERAKQHARLVFYKERPDSLPIKYFVNAPGELYHDRPVFIDDSNRLLALTQPVFFVTSVEYFETLPPQMQSQFTILGNDRVGRVQVVVFRRK